MVHEERSESLEESFRKHRNGSYRPHMGPSGKAFEKYKESGQQRDKPSHSSPAHEFGTSQSLEETFSPGLIGRVTEYFLGSPDTTVEDYQDLEELVDGEHGSIDPSEYKVPEVQEWIDRQLEEGDYQMVGKVLAAEELGKERVGVLDYVEERELQEFPDEDPLEEIEVLE